MEIQKEMKKMTLGHEIGAGAMCLKCKDKCEGFELHFWRKICRNCKCSLEDHDVQMASAESKKVGKLFEDTKYTGLIAKLKTDGIPAYRGNKVTFPEPAKGIGKVVTFEWAPRVANQHLVERYMELLPPEKRPVSGTQGAEYRKRQMAKQLPEHDQDPSHCHELSPGEVKIMQQYVRKCKDEALGVGDLKLLEELVGGVTPSGAEGHAAQGGKSCPETDLKDGTRSLPEPEPQAYKATISTTGSAGAQGNSGKDYLCFHCHQEMREGTPAVYADRAGYDKLWHPACFVCCVCTELLVDMIYFWKKDKLYCGRHYGESEKPRCGGCDELIFSNEYTQAESQNWHLKHFCCYDCDCVLAGETYVMEKDKPVCTTCYMKNYAMICVACQTPIEPEAQRVSYGESHWHAEPKCFQCSGCSKCLIGQRFMAMKNMLICSVECKKILQKTNPPTNVVI
ncbi:testin [Clupea harengus]|uniref:Testin n=1 Tax=Clupea harengus TaxID=7950 RepID=A0A6P3VEU3_CLUHA|nr:testin [Clupea harengus]